MPLSPNLDVTKTVTKKPGKFWVNVAIPAASQRLTLDANGYPDATENPLAKNIGFTEDGATFAFTRKLDNRFADEIKSPIDTTISETGLTLSGKSMQVLDWDLLTTFTAGFGTKTSGSGFEQLTFGDAPLAKTGICFIFEYAPAKFAVYHLYQAINMEGGSLEIGRTKNTAIAFKFEAYAVASRAATDQLGSAWKQV